MAQSIFKNFSRSEKPQGITAQWCKKIDRQYNFRSKLLCEPIFSTLLFVNVGRILFRLPWIFSFFSLGRPPVHRASSKDSVRKLDLLGTLALVFVAAGCQTLTNDPTKIIFSQLPPRQAIIVHVDVTKAGPKIVERLHKTIGLFDKTSAQTLFSFRCDTLSYLKDINTLTFSADENRRTLIVSGHFNEKSLLDCFARAQSECRDTFTHTPCVVLTPDTSHQLKVTIPDQRTLLFTESVKGPPVQPVSPTTIEIRTFGTDRSLQKGGVAWAAIIPARLPQTLGIETGNFLGLLNRSLESSRIAYFRLTMPRSVNRNSALALTLIAEFATSEAAQQHKGLIEGLLALGTSVIGARGNTNSPWSRILRSGQFRHEAHRVHAKWTLDPLLEDIDPN